MCIICNCTKGGSAEEEVANMMKACDFLDSFEVARSSMRRAAGLIHTLSKIDRRYDRTHKRMIRLIRDWNRIEQEREASSQRPSP